MTRGGWRVTYDTVTAESAESGEFAESGWASAGGWKSPADDRAAAEERHTLREAISIAGGGLYDAGRWFASRDSEIDYGTGDETTYSIHPPTTITAASYRRVARLVCGGWAK
jgi:hypothetical protein